jgi:hypothetical protein
MPFQIGNKLAAGNRGNPYGSAGARARYREMGRVLKLELQEIDTSGPDRGRTQYQKIARTLIHKSVNGDVEAIKLVFVTHFVGCVSFALGQRRCYNRAGCDCRRSFYRCCFCDRFCSSHTPNVDKHQD